VNSLFDSLQKIGNKNINTTLFCVVYALRSIRVSIPDDTLRDIDLLIKIGRYNSRDEVIAKALNDLLNREFVKINYVRYLAKSY
jgi:hypothetical protein